MGKQLDMKISGMHCNSCAKIIEDRLLELEGIEKAEVNYAEEKATIEFDSDKISRNSIEEEIAKLGYSAGGRTPVPPATSLKQGIIYGLVPHIGCIGFIAASVLGVTVAIEFFRPLLMNPWFFHILVLISLGFATLSSAIYLRKQGILSMKGIQRKKKYLSTMYGATVGINLILFLGVFPLLANIDTGSFAGTGMVSAASFEGTAQEQGSVLRLAVNIPCPGHAPLISGELKTIAGVTGVKFDFPNYFDVAFDSRTSKEEILGLEVFETYSAELVSEQAETARVEEEIKSAEPLQASNNSKGTNGGYACSSCGSTSCTGSCGCGYR